MYCVRAIPRVGVGASRFGTGTENNIPSAPQKEYRYTRDIIKSPIG